MKKKLYLPIAVLVAAVAIILSFCLISPDTYTQGIPESPTIADNGGNAADSTGIPVIYYPETSFDFGTIKQDEKVTHTYIVKNNGDAPLKLIKAKGS